ncbi:MAG: hypothetical protein ACSHWN_10095 [Methylophilaceae bacterium]
MNKVLKSADDAPKTKASYVKRAISGVAYPYFDHDSSIKVAEVVHNVGGGNCATDFLAAQLGYSSIKSGTYLTRVAAARMFGYVSTNDGNFFVTELGRAIVSPVMPEDSANAKVAGFLNVPLFAKVFEDFKGKQLPPDTGLKNLFLNNYKIVPDRVDSALRVFINSSEQCGFFQSGRDRLIKPSVFQGNNKPPITPDAPVNQEPQTSVEKPRGGNSGDSGYGGVDTAIIGLLRKLPSQGEEWTNAEQTRFLTAFNHTIQFLYPPNNDDS